MKLNLHEIQNIQLALHSYAKMIRYKVITEEANKIIKLKDKIGNFLAKEKEKINVDITIEGENNGNT